MNAQSKHLVSIIILNHNAREFLGQTLDSIKTQRGIAYEVIIVDNNSDDGSRELVRQFYPDFTWIERTTSTGFAAGNNLGLTQAKGDLILFLNPDASFLTPDDLSRCVAKLLSDDTIGCLTPRVNLAISGALDQTCHRGFPTPWASFTHFSGLARIFPHSKLFSQYNLTYLDDSLEHEVDSIGGMFFLIKKSVGDKIGWWDDDYPLYGEDLDFCYRLRLAGYRNLYYPSVVVLHYKGATTGMSKHSRSVTKASSSTTRQVKLWSIQAMQIFYDKHYADQHSIFFNWFVHLGIKLLKFYRLTIH